MRITQYHAGNYRQQYQYKSFAPTPLCQEWEIDDATLIHLLSQANIKLGELNAFSQLVPDIDFFIRMHIHKEATTSSRIEGTQTNIEEAFQRKEDLQEEKRDDWEEVHNYINAMNQAITELTELPLSTRLIRNTHHALLQGVRGTHKQPGEFRSSQNWIGGASLQDAVFIPPHHTEVADLMSDLEKFIHDDNVILPDLVRIALIHYQFETIHPFLDGNGRMGRLLITLYLVSKGILVKPTLYLSDFFERNKTLYYDNLTRVRTHHNMRQWLLFFLEGVRQTAENSTETFRSIIRLRHDCETRLSGLGKKVETAQTFLQYLYRQPVVNSTMVAQELALSAPATLRLLEDFVCLEILEEVTGYKRNRLFVFRAYINLFH
jgi:Fic family protein